MTRTDAAKRMLDETKLELERKNHTRVVELCDKLLADYSDVINMPGVQDTESIPFLVEICGSGLVLNLYVARKPQFLLQGLSQCR